MLRVETEGVCSIGGEVKIDCEVVVVGLLGWRGFRGIGAGRGGRGLGGGRGWKGCCYNGLVRYRGGFAV